MIDLKYISGFFPATLRDNPAYAKHMVKEYVQLMVLDYISTTPHVEKLAFIGGTNLRLIKGIDRWSEDLDFDCRAMTRDEFLQMTNDVIEFLRRSGLKAEPKDRDNTRLSAFRRNIYFPHLLFDLQLTGHKDERFLLKIEAQDQGFAYQPEIVNVKGCGFFFALPVPPDSVLLAMKISALLSRAKGRDFYDTMFLMAQTEPDYSYLKYRCGISNISELKKALNDLLTKVDLNIKKKDFEHLLFSASNGDKIIRFPQWIESV